MKQLSRDLESVLKTLKALTQKTEEIQKELSKLEKTATAKKPKARTTAKRRPAVRKPTSKRAPKVAALDTVLGVVQASKKGVSTEEIRNKTRFDNRKIWGIISRAKKEGKVKSVRRGVYGKA